METAQDAAPSKRSAASAGRFYLPELDALRFLAFSLVFLSHSAPVLGAGRHGVQIFFVLSAFLITELLLRERETTDKVNITAFYIRRALRIWPLYYTMLLLCFLFSLSFHYHLPTIEWLAYLFFLGNCSTASTGHYLTWGWGVLWTVTVEEQFYLVWPTIIRLGGRTGIILISILVWIAGQVACLRIAAHVGADTYATQIWTNSLVNYQYFAIGAILAVCLHNKRIKIAIWARLALAAIGLLTFQLSEVSFLRYLPWLHNDMRTYVAYLATGISSALILIAFIGFNVPAKLQWAVYLGKISFGLYVFHRICLLFAGAIGAAVFHIHSLAMVKTYWISIPLTLLIASLSYRYLETPFLHLKTRFEIIRSRLA